MARTFAKVKADLKLPLDTFKRGMGVVRNIFKTEKNKGITHTISMTASYIKQGTKKHLYKTSDFLTYALPLGSLFIFVTTIAVVLNYNYVLAISYNNQNLGTIKTDAVYTDAQQMINSRLVFADDTQSFTLKPMLSIAVEDENSLNSAGLANAILQASGEEISEATGFYVDGVFYGATKDSELMRKDLDALLAPYRQPNNPNVRVEFARDVKLVDGIYLKESIVNYEEINKLFHTQVQGQREYTVSQGDSYSGIASKNGITQNDLFALNPGLDGAMMHPGQVLVIGKMVTFLPVKTVERIVYNVDIPYKVERTPSQTLAFGKSSVTTKGEVGIKEITADITYIDGVKTSEDIINTVITKEPVNEKIVVGTLMPGGNTAEFIRGTGRFLWPVGSPNGVSRGFSGVNAHNGIDIYASRGTPIYAADSGVVTRALYTNRGYGIYVMVDHGNGIVTLYGHCSALYVQVGQAVSKGQVIAAIGSTGNSTGPHCHFEAIVNGIRVNPALYF